jgi:hypothetical protein
MYWLYNQYKDTQPFSGLDSGLYLHSGRRSSDPELVRGSQSSSFSHEFHVTRLKSSGLSGRAFTSTITCHLLRISRGLVGLSHLSLPPRNLSGGVLCLEHSKERVGCHDLRHGALKPGLDLRRNVGPVKNHIGRLRDGQIGLLVQTSHE